MSEFQIDPALVSKALRQLADRLEQGQIRIETVEHQVWKSQKSEWLTVKWVRQD
jgi:hypothetical protein